MLAVELALVLALVLAFELDVEAGELSGLDEGLGEDGEATPMGGVGAVAEGWGVGRSPNAGSGEKAWSQLNEPHPPKTLLRSSRVIQGRKRRWGKEKIGFTGFGIKIHSKNNRPVGLAPLFCRELIQLLLKRPRQLPSQGKTHHLPRDTRFTQHRRPHIPTSKQSPDAFGPSMETDFPGQGLHGIERWKR